MKLLADKFTFWPPPKRPKTDPPLRGELPPSFDFVEGCCPVCGGEVIPSAHGRRPKIYCSRPCSQRASTAMYRVRLKR